MSLSLIVAMAENRVIGNKDALPWHLPNDLKFFKQQTLKKTIIMGRCTYESIGKALPNRRNIVLSRQPAFHLSDAETAQTLNQALDYLNHHEDAVIIGGAQIYAQALPLVDELLITQVHTQIDGDTLFPAWDKSRWQQTWAEPHTADDKHAYAYTFTRWVKRS